MADLQKILADITAAIVDKPDEIRITEEDDGDNVTLTLSVAPEDMGKVIGRHGRIAKAIRLIMKAAANSVDKKTTIDIK